MITKDGEKEGKKSEKVKNFPRDFILCLEELLGLNEREHQFMTQYKKERETRAKLDILYSEGDFREELKKIFK